MRNADMTALIRASLPTLKAEGESLTRLFYHKLLSAHPELAHLFNSANQAQGLQQRALASAICAYATHIDHPQALKDAVNLIANKHVALGVRAEHYPLVGQTLLASLQELLGEAATPALLEAWALAYQQLADLLIRNEADLYQKQYRQFGWQGFKPMVIADKQWESPTICSFYIQTIDSRPLAAHQPGQYVTLKLSSMGEQMLLRHYSISNAPGEGVYRISVRRHVAESQPDGLVSNYLHDAMKSGDAILMAPPSGHFVLDETEQPLLLVAGGVGITPLLSMLYASLQQMPVRQVTLVHSVRRLQDMPFENELSRLKARYSNFNWHVCLTGEAPGRQVYGASLSAQRLDAELLNQLTQQQAATIYACGPRGLLAEVNDMVKKRQIQADRLLTEQFSPAH